MKEFGYSINKDRQIDYDLNDKKVSKFISLEEPTFNICIACGTCTATCTAGINSNYNFRRLMVMLRRGEEAQALSEINNCMLCGKCTLVCPRGVNTRNIIIAIKKAKEYFKYI